MTRELPGSKILQVFIYVDQDLRYLVFQMKWALDER